MIGVLIKQLREAIVIASDLNVDRAKQVKENTDLLSQNDYNSLSRKGKDAWSVLWKHNSRELEQLAQRTQLLTTVMIAIVSVVFSAIAAICSLVTLLITLNS